MIKSILLYDADYFGFFVIPTRGDKFHGELNSPHIA